MTFRSFIELLVDAHVSACVLQKIAHQEDCELIFLNRISDYFESLWLSKMFAKEFINCHFKPTNLKWDGVGFLVEGINVYDPFDGQS